MLFRQRTKIHQRSAHLWLSIQNDQFFQLLDNLAETTDLSIACTICHVSDFPLIGTPFSTEQDPQFHFPLGFGTSVSQASASPYMIFLGHKISPFTQFPLCKVTNAGINARVMLGCQVPIPLKGK